MPSEEPRRFDGGKDIKGEWSIRVNGRRIHIGASYCPTNSLEGCFITQTPSGGSDTYKNFTQRGDEAGTEKVGYQKFGAGWVYDITSLQTVYLRILKNGTSYGFAYSSDGESWITKGTPTEDYNPLYAGMALKTWSTYPAAQYDFEFYTIRKYCSPEPVHGGWGPEETYYALLVRCIGTIRAPYSEKVRCIGTTIFGAWVRNIGSVKARIFFYDRHTGIIRGFYSSKVRLTGKPRLPMAKVRLTGIIRGLLSEKVRSMGDVGLPLSVKVRLSGLLSPIERFLVKHCGRVSFELPEGVVRVTRGVESLYLYEIIEAPVTRENVIVEHISPGGFESHVSHLGGKEFLLQVKGLLRPEKGDAKPILEKLRGWVGEEVHVDVQSHGKMQWASGDFLLKRVEENLISGMHGDYGSENVHYILHLTKI